MSDKRTCNDCAFAVFEDYGYSNYTVEGTEFSCAKRKHPDGSFDRFYGKTPQLDYAKDCDGFKNGEPIDLDCECEAEDDLSAAQKEILKMHRGQP